MTGEKQVGAGRPKADPLLKKNPICLKLPQWLIDKLNQQTESKAIQIEKALCKFYNWRKPK
jgi:hypothetical protein